MGRSSTTFEKKWAAGKTVVIRVPEKYADRLVALARSWDDAGEMRLGEHEQGLLLDVPKRAVRYDPKRPVNVASVPHRSPFRYPGGKTWFVPYLRSWLQSRPIRPARMIEPFAGGAICSMTAGFERLARHVIFAEMDADIAAVWRVVLNGQAEWLANRILSYNVNLKNVTATLAAQPTELRERAFKTLLKNRVHRGGILADGAGLIKVGENGKGLKSRWYPETLARRIREINAEKDRFTFVEGDAFQLIEEHARDEDSVFYVDPPYTKAAARLYTHWQVDHRRLFAALAGVAGDFLMSYDHTPEIADLAREFNFETRAIAMKNTHHAKMTELLIGRDLGWFQLSAES